MPFYLSSASFIQCSRTGLIFWALFGVMSSFSNLQEKKRTNLKLFFSLQPITHSRLFCFISSKFLGRDRLLRETTAPMIIIPSKDVWVQVIVPMDGICLFSLKYFAWNAYKLQLGLLSRVMTRSHWSSGFGALDLLSKTYFIGNGKYF